MTAGRGPITPPPSAVDPFSSPRASFTRLTRVALLAAAAFVSSRCGMKSPTAPQPAKLGVSSIAPVVGSTTGGVVVTVVGTDFGADATLTVGGVAATNVVVQEGRTISGVIGARTLAGPADVVVTSGGRSATLANAFTFVAPTGTNQPPIITDIRSNGSRVGQPSGFADLGETVTLVAGVSDNETPASALVYDWSGDGLFSGSGPSVGWIAPASLSATPAPATIRLKVSETFTEGSVTHRHESSPRTFVMQVHDSRREILDMGVDFLTLFSRSEVGTNDVLHNFSTTCDRGRGRGDESGDVDANRLSYIEDFSKFRIQPNPVVTFNFGGRCSFRSRPADACSSYTVHWEVVARATGERSTADGIDYVTAVLENNRWQLCHSDFQGFETNLTTGITRFVEW